MVIQRPGSNLATCEVFVWVTAISRKKQLIVITFEHHYIKLVLYIEGERG